MEERLSGLFRSGGAFVSRFAWLVLAVWILLLGTLNIALPQLERVIADNSAAFIPEGNEASQTLKQMARDFGNPESSAVGFFVLANDAGLGAADRDFYASLTARLVEMPEHVAYVMDTQATPEGREYTTSKDGNALTLMTVLHGDNGTTEATEATEAVRGLAAELNPPPGLEVKFSGPVATTSDQLQAIDRSMLIITGVSVILISIALLIAYRRLAVVVVALGILGVSLGIARPVVGILGANGILEMSMFTAALMTALVIGAGTDYAVFVIGRFQEARRSGLSVPESAADSVGGIATVIIASGLTVAAACMSMIFTQVGIFRTAGPPIAVGILVALAVALTLGPALLTILGKSGAADAVARPASARAGAHGPTRSERLWRRRATRVVRRPLPALLLALLVLAPFGALALTNETNFDEFSAQPADSESNQGYALAGRHFPENELVPNYLIVRADHDLRNTRDLAALEQVAAAVAEVDGVTEVRSITRPDGDPLSESALGYQAGVIADGLAGAADQIEASGPDLDRLADGTVALADGAAALVDGAGQLADGARQLDAGLAQAQAGLPELVAGTGQVTQMARSVLATLDAAQRVLDTASGNTVGAAQSIAQLRLVVATVDRVAATMRENASILRGASTGLDRVFGPMLDPARCGADPQCQALGTAFAQLDSATGNQAGAALAAAIRAGDEASAAPGQLTALAQELGALLDALDTALAGLAGQGSTDDVRSELDRLDAGVAELRDGVDQLADGGRQLQVGADALLDGSRQLADGTEELRDGAAVIPGMMGELTAGLGEATDYLDGMRQHASTGPGAGFYLPDFAFGEPRFVTASQFFLSPDGRTARMTVIGSGNPLAPAAIASIDEYRDRAVGAAAGSSLSGAEFKTTGFAAVYSDLDGEITADFILVAIICLAAITLILGLLLRSVVAPLIITATSVVSFVATIGIGVLVWQHLLDTPLHWSVIPLAFVLLVGVGADYSVLAITRIRQESARTVSGATMRHGGLPLGVIRGLGSTGGLITVAGVVFAVTMFALMAGGIYILAQLGFIVGIGLMLDILLVRAVLVPALLVLLGRVSWWPARS